MALQTCAEASGVEQGSYVKLSGSSNNAWLCWWPSMGMMLWRPVGTCWTEIRTFPYPRRGGHPPGQGRRALKSPRPCFPTSEESQVFRTWQVNYHSSSFHYTLLLSLLEKEEIMGWDWCWSQQHRSVGQHLLKEGQPAPWVVGEILDSTLHCGWVLQGWPGPAYGPSASCGFPPTSHTEGSAWHLAHST